MRPAEYVQFMQPYAQTAAAQTGLPVPLILAQWANESGWGGSELAVDHFNHGGIKWVAETTQGYEADGFAGYLGLDQFVADYSRVLNLSYYAGARAAARAGEPIESVAQALGRSPYDEGGYMPSSADVRDGVPRDLLGVRGGKLINLLRTYPELQRAAPMDRPVVAGGGTKIVILALSLVLIGLLYSARRQDRIIQ